MKDKSESSVKTVKVPDGMTTEEAVSALILIKNLATSLSENSIDNAIARVEQVEEAMEGLSFKEAVKYIKHGREMEETLKLMTVILDAAVGVIRYTLAKLDKE